VDVDCGTQQRGFEYVVTQDWIASAFCGSGCKPRARRPTPDYLMIRVSGSCDISFYPTGHIALAQIRGLLRNAGHSIEEFRTILDFGCGCARALLALHNEGARAALWLRY